MLGLVVIVLCLEQGMESPAFNPLVLESILQGGVCQPLSLSQPGETFSVSARMEKTSVEAQSRTGLRWAWVCWKAVPRQLLQRLLWGVQCQWRRRQCSFIADCFLFHMVSLRKTSTEVRPRLGDVLEAKAESYRLHSAAFHDMVPFYS